MKTPANKVLVIAAFALATCSAGALGATRPDEVSIRVRCDDIDLLARADVERLKRRVQFAAEKACGRSSLGPLWAFSRGSECVRDAVDEAMAQVRLQFHDR